MSKMEFLDPLEAEKFKKQKCVQFCRTPCILYVKFLLTLLETIQPSLLLSTFVTHTFFDVLASLSLVLSVKKDLCQSGFSKFWFLFVTIHSWVMNILLKDKP